MFYGSRFRFVSERKGRRGLRVPLRRSGSGGPRETLSLPLLGCTEGLSPRSPGTERRVRGREYLRVRTKRI